MAIQEQVTAEEWRVLRSAPGAAAMYVATAVGGRVQEVRELLVFRAGLHRESERAVDDDLVAEVATALVGEALTGEEMGMRRDDRPGMLRTVAEASTRSLSLPGGAAYRRWLLNLAREVASAEADGGFLGFGATDVHNAEEAALVELAAALQPLE